jgi:hypothetical protein
MLARRDFNPCLFDAFWSKQYLFSKAVPFSPAKSTDSTLLNIGFDVSIPK